MPFLHDWYSEEYYIYCIELMYSRKIISIFLNPPSLKENVITGFNPAYPKEKFGFCSSSQSLFLFRNFFKTFFFIVTQALLLFLRKARSLMLGPPGRFRGNAFG